MSMTKLDVSWDCNRLISAAYTRLSNKSNLEFKKHASSVA